MFHDLNDLVSFLQLDLKYFHRYLNNVDNSMQLEIHNNIQIYLIGQVEDNFLLKIKIKIKLIIVFFIIIFKLTTVNMVCMNEIIMLFPFISSSIFSCNDT